MATIALVAFGAKIGQYLSAIQEASNINDWITTGFVYGSTTGLVGSTVIIAAYALIKQGEESSQFSGDTSFT